MSQRLYHLPEKDIQLAVNFIIEHMVDTLSSNERIEIRGFGSFTLHEQKPRIARNPKTGQSVFLPRRFVPHFKPSQNLRQRSNNL